tara:strand:+ start:23968 stop:25614 length:1647 start_codon:yes stop_codon:yes gene_type:complete
MLTINIAWAQGPSLSWSGNLYKKSYEYKRLHKKFSKQVCSGGADQKYYKYLRSYRGSGFYLPLFGNDIDRAAIKSNLSHFKKKVSFIEKTEKKLKKLEKLPSFEEVAAPLRESLRKLLNYKKIYSQELGKKELDKLKKKSNEELASLKKHLDIFFEKVFFLKSYNFPNDHLKNRREFELSKFKEDTKSKKKANRVFFFRKIVEDGTYNKKNGGSDLYLRSTLDTLYLTVKKERNFISENLRYDLEWTLRYVEKVLSRGKEEQLDRLSDWAERTQRNYDFYKDIVKVNNKDKAKKLVKDKNEATIKLKEYVYTKQAEAYKWWMKQPELMRAVYVLETILFNEVGRVDGPDALERADVAQIVLNRVEHPFYSSLDPNQELVKHLGLSEEKYKDNKWLNTLFRVGEFSFTYHYISSVVKIFCPDMSYVGRSLRDKNVKISLKAIKNYRKDFDVLRYFSRVSMLGKIDMSTVWHGYKHFPERPGYEVGTQRNLVRLYLGDKYQYLYSFTDPKGNPFEVIKIGDETYSVTWVKGRPKFFKYRDPHLFKYFIKK